MKNNILKKLVVIAMLIALNIVFSRLISISAWNFKISLTFITGLIAAYFYGPFWSAVVCGAGDLIGALLFPIGEFNPLFTLTAIVSGLIYGIFLYDNLNTKNVIIAVLLNQLGCSLLLNTLFISVVYNTSYGHLLVTRFVQSIVMLLIEFFVIKSLSSFLRKMRVKVVNE